MTLCLNYVIHWLNLTHINFQLIFFIYLINLTYLLKSVALSSHLDCGY